MKKLRNLGNLFASILVDSFKLVKLRVYNALGLYDNSCEKMHFHFKELWKLGYVRKNEMLFRNYVKGQIAITESKLTNYYERKHNILTVLVAVLLINLPFFLLFIIFPYPLLRLILGLMIFTIILIGYIVLIIRHSKIPSENKVIETERFLSILQKYNKAENPFNLLNNNELMGIDKGIILPFTPAEISAFFGLIYANTKVEGLRQTQVASFIENYCMQVDGKPYQFMDSRISKIKNNPSECQSALNDLVYKLTHNNQ